MRRRTLGIIAVNLLVLLALVGGIEAYFRYFHPQEQQFQATNGLWQTFKPFVMIGTAVGEYPKWDDLYTGKSIPSTVRTNSDGFNDAREFSLTKPYQKAGNEKVVIVTSGSTGWGVGASATDKTVAGRLQFHLNSMQNKIKYSVVNMSMGSWMAIQQFVALQLWGSQFDPDWVITLDGFNDAGVGCQFMQGVGNPLYFATMQSYIHGYLLSAAEPVFYRGWLENQIIRRSAAYRALTGKQYVKHEQVLDPTSTDKYAVRREGKLTPVGAARDMLDFYIGAERGIVKLFPKAKYILSTQPVVNQFTGDFVDIYAHPVGSAERAAAITKREQGLEAYLKHYEKELCGEKTGKVAFTYVFGNGAVRLERLAEEERASGRHVEYINTGALLPDAHAQRTPFFIDGPHLTDLGNDVIGKYYAERILLADAADKEPGRANK